MNIDIMTLVANIFTALGLVMAATQGLVYFIILLAWLLIIILLVQ